MGRVPPTGTLLTQRDPPDTMCFIRRVHVPGYERLGTGVVTAHLILTAVGPILTVRTREGVDAPESCAVLRQRGLHKPIVFEISLETSL